MYKKLSETLIQEDNKMIYNTKESADLLNNTDKKIKELVNRIDEKDEEYWDASESLHKEISDINRLYWTERSEHDKLKWKMTLSIAMAIAGWFIAFFLFVHHFHLSST